MKKQFGLFLLCALMLIFAGCGSNKNYSDFPIPENGIIGKDVFEDIKNNNDIGVFSGKSGSYTYTVKVFGKDITSTRDQNFLITIEALKDQKGLSLKLSEKSPFDFPVSVSITLEEKWNAQDASLYKEAEGKEERIFSVSVNSKEGKTVLNFSLNPADFSSSYTIHAENEVVPEENPNIVRPKPSASKDEFDTDPVPDGKPDPVEPEDQDVDKDKIHHCLFTIECSTILNNLENLKPEKLEVLPSDGIILETIKVEFKEGESVFDVLQRVCKENGIHMESSFTPMYNSAYIEGIHNLYEFDCGALSGWMYSVNDWFPNYGVSRYQLKDGDVVEFRYTCDLGHDLGCDYLE